MEVEKTRIARTILKRKEKVGELRTPDFKGQYKIRIIKTM